MSRLFPMYRLPRIKLQFLKVGEVNLFIIMGNIFNNIAEEWTKKDAKTKFIAGIVFTLVSFSVLYPCFEYLLNYNMRGKMFDIKHLFYFRL